MNRVLFTIRNGLILGSRHQSFLDAHWVSLLLRLVPSRFKESTALRILALSPHYFYRKLQPASVTGRKFLDAEFARNRHSRNRLFDIFIAPEVSGQSTVLEIGCGPGFLAKRTAQSVRLVYAADISAGVLACAQILNSAPNIKYIDAARNRYAEVPRHGVDFVYSFAVIQHCTDAVFENILLVCREKMKAGARGLFHIVMDDPSWTTEKYAVGDTSVTGRIKYRYGLNWFSRQKSEVVRLFDRVGLKVIDIRRASENGIEGLENDDISSQDLVRFARP